VVHEAYSHKFLLCKAAWKPGGGRFTVIPFARNPLNLKDLFCAFQTGILLKAASNQGFASVCRLLSTKLSTVFVDSPKSTYESDAYDVFESITLAFV
jgi:hypothetical protein